MMYTKVHSRVFTKLMSSRNVLGSTDLTNGISLISPECSAAKHKCQEPILNTID